MKNRTGRHTRIKSLARLLALLAAAFIAFVQCSLEPDSLPAGIVAARGMMGGGGGGGGGGMGGGGGSTIIDPPPGSPFADPPVMTNLSGTPGVVEVNLDCRVAPVNVNGTVANLWTYNGSYPAPTIRVRSGDLLRIHFTNSLPDSGVNILGHPRDLTNLHTHGLHVSPSGNADNMMLMAMSGESLEYEYDLSKQEPGTLNFYHPHIHGNVAEQYWSGMAGALEVRRRDPRPRRLRDPRDVPEGHHPQRRRPAALHEPDGLHARQGGHPRHGERAGEPGAQDPARARSSAGRSSTPATPASTS